MKKAMILLMMIGLNQAAFMAAEDPALKETKKLYAATAAAIARAQQGEAGGLYCNELTVNSRNGSWRAVGNYAKKAVFWYSDQPAFAAAEGLGAETVLAKVEVSETSAVRSLYREFYFAGGRLCFFFRSEKNNGEPVGEERIYFRDGKPMLQLPGRGNAAVAVQAEVVAKEARYWQKLFLLSFAD